MKNLVLIILALNLNFIQAQVGVGTTTPQSTLDVNGNVSFKVVNLNGGPGGFATVISDGYYINLTPTAGNVEFILPNAVSFPGRMYVLRNISDTVTATLYSFGGAFFPGDSRTSVTSLTLDPDADANGGSPTKTLIFISDGSNWTYGHFHL